MSEWRNWKKLWRTRRRSSRRCGSRSRNPKKLSWCARSLRVTTERVRREWLNDGVKGFLSSRAELVSGGLPQFSHLRLTRPTERYLLAMKCLAARAGGLETQGDKDDIEFLARRLGLRSAEEVL